MVVSGAFKRIVLSLQQWCCPVSTSLSANKFSLEGLILFKKLVLFFSQAKATRLRCHGTLQWMQVY